MKFHFYPDTGSLYIEMKATPGTETLEVSDGINMDLDANGDVVGFDIDHVSRKMDMTSLETFAFHVPVDRVA